MLPPEPENESRHRLNLANSPAQLARLAAKLTARLMMAGCLHTQFEVDVPMTNTSPHTYAPPPNM